MTIIIILGVIGALILGVGAGQGKRSIYGIGFWGSVILAVISFFVTTVVHAVLFVAGMLVIVAITWLIALSHRVGSAIEKQ